MSWLDSHSFEIIHGFDLLVGGVIYSVVQSKGWFKGPLYLVKVLGHNIYIYIYIYIYLFIFPFSVHLFLFFPLSFVNRFSLLFPLHSHPVTRDHRPIAYLHQYLSSHFRSLQSLLILVSLTG